MGNNVLGQTEIDWADAEKAFHDSETIFNGHQTMIGFQNFQIGQRLWSFDRRMREDRCIISGSLPALFNAFVFRTTSSKLFFVGLGNLPVQLPELSSSATRTKRINDLAPDRLIIVLALCGLINPFNLLGMVIS